MVGPREITLMRQRVRAGERGRAMEHLLKSTPLEVQHHALKVGPNCCPAQPVARLRETKAPTHPPARHHTGRWRG
jgi:hypothetical protein